MTLGSTAPFSIFNGKPVEPPSPGMIKTNITVSVDADVIASFKSAGADWEARINRTLSAA